MHHEKVLSECYQQVETESSELPDVERRNFGSLPVSGRSPFSHKRIDPRVTMNVQTISYQGAEQVKSPPSSCRHCTATFN